MAVDAKKLMLELHIDDDPDELETVTQLIADSNELIKSSVNYNMSDSELSESLLFNRAVKSLATSMYYDRDLSNGMPKAVSIMVTHLQSRLGGK